MVKLKDLLSLIQSNELFLCVFNDNDDYKDNDIEALKDSQINSIYLDDEVIEIYVDGPVEEKNNGNT